VLGYSRPDGLLEIHKISCEKALRLKSQDGRNIISCEWAGHKSLSLPGVIRIKGIDRKGMMSEITKIITNDMSVNIRSLKLDTNDGVFSGTIEVSIHDADDINSMIARLRKLKGVVEATRAE
jgi:GTP pyrophosphokinase